MDFSSRARDQFWMQGVSVAVMVAASAILVAQPAAAQTPQTAAPIQLDDVVVTGERSERRLQNTPSSVTVIGAKEIERRSGARNLADGMEGVPNLTPRGSSELPAIRGIQSSPTGGVGISAITGGLPRAPLVVDDITRPTSLQPFSFLGFFDLSQVEVLRGPQTTFRGRSAISGAYVVRRNDPVFFNEFAVRTGIQFAPGFGSPDYVAAGMANVVLAPGLAAARLTVQRQGTNDFRKVLYPNGVLDRDSSFADGNLTALGSKLLLTPMGPDGPLQIKILGDFSRGRVPQLRDAVTGPGALGFPFSARITPSAGQGFQRIYNVEAATFGVDMSYRFADGSQLRSISSYAGESSKSSADQTEPLRFNVSERLLNQDLLYTFGKSEDRFSGLIGATLNQRRQSAAVDNSPARLRISDLNTLSNSQAIFADLRFGLTGQLDVLFGGRLNRNEDKREQTIFSPLAGRRTLTSGKTEVVALPKLGLHWKINPDHSLFATVRQGYNPGGSSLNLLSGQPFTFESEKVTTYEMTYRGAFLNNGLTLSATGFYNQHQNAQAYIQRVPGNRFSLEVVNLPRAVSYGGEFEARMRLHETLQARLGLGLLITEVTRAPATQAGIKGNRFGFDPALTPSFGLSWTPLPGLTLDASATYVSRYFSDVINNPVERNGNYTMVDVAAAYEFRPNMTARAFVKNVTDVAALTRRIGNTNADITPPRTFGLSFDARF
jgi:outer membrane receptor protein involved in Fe transport